MSGTVERLTVVGGWQGRLPGGPLEGVVGDDKVAGVRGTLVAGKMAG